MLVLVGMILMLFDPKVGIIVMMLGVLEGMFIYIKERNKPTAGNIPIEILCPPHKWEYDANGFLMCSKCKRVPGQQDPADDGR